MAEAMEVVNGAAHAAIDKGKAPMVNGTAAKPSKGYDLPWVSCNALVWAFAAGGGRGVAAPRLDMHHLSWTAAAMEHLRTLPQRW